MEDAKFLNEAKADYAGFVFYEKSKRNVTFAEAKEIAKVLHPQIKKVAVTVSPTAEWIKEIEQLDFDILQVHGEFNEKIIKGMNIPIWRAINVTDLGSLENTFRKETEEIQTLIKGYVIDGAGYGSGKPFDWAACSKKVCELTTGKKLILAGGLDTGNVRTGMKYFRPDIVDVSSSVEEKGNKSKTKIEEFIRKVRENEQ